MGWFLVIDNSGSIHGRKCRAFPEKLDAEIFWENLKIYQQRFRVIIQCTAKKYSETDQVSKWFLSAI